LRVEDHWVKLEIQIDFLRAIWADLGDRFQIHQNNVLRVLQCKLQEATILLDSAVGKSEDETTIKHVIGKKGRLHKGAFALSLQECLETIIGDLDRWHTMFDPSWFLISRITSPKIDQQLADQRAGQGGPVSTMRGLRDELKTDLDTPEKKASIFITATDFLGDTIPIPFSSSRLSKERKTGEDVIVDTIVSHPMADISTTTRDIRNFARVLSKVEPLSFGLLACRGVIKLWDPAEKAPKFEFVFDVPRSLRAPRSLRDLLLAGDLHPLDERIVLAKQLAKSVSYVHTSQFVHKNIRPETILVFENSNSVLGTLFLLGFEKFRPAGGTTYRMGDTLWEKDIYCHPTRQGLQPEEYYIMQHDIYSLGVCLLEIGLWNSFVIWNQGADKPTPNSELHIEDTLQMKDQRKRGFEIKHILIDRAQRHLPSRMGKRYTEIVISCLTCLDARNEAFGDEDFFLDEDGIEVGVRYIEKVVLLPRI
jgi:hypothetical protein